ncbi:hypothetical protein BS50DRAFT_163324 [Corynespora cassiicola Philippines]|uniref:Uncharacterized protein n=1 Tax=Corynespora cassiicola Philippines TaxID=1448308 RepID=A0A2T2N7N5_CORCC|nr:hypothetical protein BS50DRAFT_163324 [Corynespora cassiicola Philippines]
MAKVKLWDATQQSTLSAGTSASCRSRPDAMTLLVGQIAQSRSLMAVGPSRSMPLQSWRSPMNRLPIAYNPRPAQVPCVPSQSERDSGTPGCYTKPHSADPD